MTRGLVASYVNGWLDTDFATNWIKLHTGDPGSAGTSNAAAGDTSRKQATMASAASGSKAMTGTAGTWTNVSTTETITDISIWTLVTSGAFKASAALSASQAWVNTNTFTLTALTIAIAPIAA